MLEATRRAESVAPHARMLCKFASEAKADCNHEVVESTGLETSDFDDTQDEVGSQ